MKRGHMMTAAALVLTGLVAVGGCNKKAKEEADAAKQPSRKPTGAQPSDANGGTTPPTTDSKINNMIQNDGARIGATTQQGADAIKRVVPTTMPSMPSMK